VAEDVFQRAILVERAADGLAVQEATEVKVDSLRDLTGRLPAGHTIPVLNDQKVLAVARHKDEFYKEFADLTSPTYVVADGVELIDAFDGLPPGKLVIKPAVGNEGAGFFMGDRTKIKDYYEQNSGLLYVVQPFVDAKAVIPGLRGLSVDDKVRVKSDRVKEIRLFASNDRLEPIVRVAKPGEVMLGNDVYTFIDPDSLADEVMALGETAMQRLMAITGINEIHAAIDIFFDQRADEQPYKLREINVKQPVLPKATENPTVAHRVKQNLADQLLRMAGTKQ
jgi:glutathione synthase/RimK-type ligase-like ATP-grasp enzyme